MKLSFDGCGLTMESGLRFATVSTSRLANDPNVQETGETIARATTACHGLDLPANVPPGVLAEAVAMVRAFVEDELSVTSLDEARAILAKLTPAAATPDPVKL